MTNREPCSGQATTPRPASSSKPPRETLGLAVCFCALQELGGREPRLASDVIAIETGADPARALALVAELHGRLPRATILLASPDGSARFHPGRRSRRARATSVAAASAERAAQDAHQAPPATAPRTAPPRPNRGGEIITVYGARGGLGATTLAVNLASQAGRTVTGRGRRSSTSTCSAATSPPS